jgi:diguanylate cyclase (GGDEF)-like protein
MRRDPEAGVRERRTHAERGHWPAVALDIAIVGLWLGSFLLARVLEHAPHASLWFPPSAVTFAALMVVGPRAVPALAASCGAATCLAELQYSPTMRVDVIVASSLAFAAVHVAAYGVPALVLRAEARREPADVTLRTVARFMLLGTTGSALAALGGVAALTTTGLIVTDAPARLVPAWWMGDFVALITLAPLMMRWIARIAARCGDAPGAWVAPFRADAAPTSRAAARKLALLAAVTVGMLAAAHAVAGRELGLALLVVPLLLQLWVVHTENRAAALHGVLLFGLLTVGMGAWLTDGVDPVTLQFAAIGLAANTYLGLAVPALYASNERLRDQVTRDRLTRVMTRAYFEDRAGHALERAVADGRNAAVILFDLDRLKWINDTHGHAAGDAVLAELASRAAAGIRVGDLLGRLGGDEFAVYLPDADATTADTAIARMRSALSDAPFPVVGTHASASFGRAELAGRELTLADLLREADAAMYADKRRRREDAGPVCAP